MFSFFGREYAAYLEILLDSFTSTNTQYSKIGNIKPTPLVKKLIKLYVSIFGIPEIGFQIRCRYFVKTLDLLKNFEPKKILDAGCGIGLYTFMLAKRYPQAQILGIDMDEYKLEFCRRFATDHHITNVQFAKGDLTKIKLGNDNYDLIVNIDVLEHIRPYQKVLKSFYSSLKLGGYFYIHTPQVNQRRIFKKFFSTWKHEEHVREGFNPELLKNDLLQTGFKSVNYWSGFGFLGRLAWELNHISLSQNILLAGLMFPIVSLISILDIRKRSLTAYYIAYK
mgnify:CR=1 FL=1